MIDGHMVAITCGSRKTDWSLAQSAVTARSSTTSPSTAYCTPRETRAFLRGLIAMTSPPRRRRAAVCRSLAGRFPEVLLVDRVVVAVLLGLRDRLVDGLEELVVLVLGNGEAVLLAGVELGGDLRVGVALDVVVEHAVVVHAGVELTALDRCREQREVLVLLHRRGLGCVRPDVVGAGGAELDADLLAGEVVEALDRGVLADQQRLRGVEVGVGEVEHLLAVIGDRHAGRSHVTLAGVEGLPGLDALERRVEDRLLEVQLLRDQVHHVDVEADDLAALVVLERLVGQVGADRQGALLDDLGTASDLCLLPAGSAPGESESE